MKTTRQTLRCDQCPAAVTIEITGVHFLDGQGRLTDRLAAHVGWDVERSKCPVHRGEIK